MLVRRVGVVLFLSSLLICRPMLAQDSQVVEDLKKRVSALEEQNRQILQLLTDIQSRLGEHPTLPTEKSQSQATTESKSTVSPQTSAPPASGLSAAAPVSPNPSLSNASASAPVVPVASSQAVVATPGGQGKPKLDSALTELGSRLNFYGWLRVDVDVDSQRPNSGEAPLYVNSADPVTGQNDQSLFSLHPRLTRLGLDFNGPVLDELAGAKLTGKLETDFENGGTESRQIIRIRHAYFQLGWDSFSVLGGQTWDIIAPLYPTVNNDTLMWDAGNLGDRRPQIRASWEPHSGQGRWSFVGGIGLTGAVDALDLTNDGYLDGQESGRPDVQERVGYSHPFRGQDAGIGISNYYGWLNTSKPVAGRTSFTGEATNIDYTLPLARILSLRGEGWWGRNMSDIRGGAGQGINTVTGREIRGKGGWSEVSLKLVRGWSIHPGITTDDPFRADVPQGGRIRNASWYFGNRVTFGPAFTFGADYIRWVTDYKGAAAGLDNRFNLFMYYGF